MRTLTSQEQHTKPGVREGQSGLGAVHLPHTRSTIGVGVDPSINTLFSSVPNRHDDSKYLITIDPHQKSRAREAPPFEPQNNAINVPAVGSSRTRSRLLLGERGGPSTRPKMAKDKLLLK